MIKKWFAAGTIGAALTLSACGSDTTEVNEEQDTTASESVEETEEEVGEAEEEPAEEEAAPEEETEESESGKRSNPVAVGETKVVDITIFDNDSNSYEGKAEITVNSITRGEEAWEEIQSTNEFNEEPADGSEYLMADVTATLIEAETEDYAWYLDAMNFNFIGSDGSPYDWTSVVVEPELNGEVYEGGTLDGKVVNMVKQDDPILLVFEDGNWDNVFFSTEE
ncbi:MULTISPECIES: hypothetical protein [unclassified Planococcus (in: firmicutes)]|uniref:hypothetical protein n=1 Tax=unclassified Planococcus (in: firmicutes) TaxID=2662419 RepID=UPI000C336AD7|nr:MULTISPECIES: hypothetical protein [unclassified Planococcus (in: firmicutes)]AUD13072.1 hypothetical protein CW734_04490 [Planococcus sp. MB-3u-03]PKG45444.1 hypothetical protein CXF66_12560 [Planococcus sp. Urea-trap-24]PKG88960.1 hypothetical protein CXF91_08975 [Planococcus sp. Urea-3u-39]PKH36328.1 hypothetical protein CXF77_14645 [Planococcus sp. MB-3u-09]